MQIWVWCMISLSTCRSTFRSTLFCPKGSWLAPASPQSRNNWPKDEIISWWMSRYRITSDEYLASYMNHSPIYLCDCCDRIGVSIHQSSVCHRVHQLILKQTNRLHRPTEVGFSNVFSCDVSCLTPFWAVPQQIMELQPVALLSASHSSSSWPAVCSSLSL